MHGSAIRCVISRPKVYGKTKNATPSKYKMAKDRPIQMPPRIYDNVEELSCCANSKQNRLTQFSCGNLGF